MSELNVYHHELRHNEYAEFYLKYEADKYIKELKEQNHELCQALHSMYSEEEMNYQKYKRCLAMAKYCKAMCGHYLSYEEPKWFLYRRWSERWLELAEQFKEGV